MESPNREERRKQKKAKNEGSNSNLNGTQSGKSASPSDHGNTKERRHNQSPNSDKRAFNHNGTSPKGR